MPLTRFNANIGRAFYRGRMALTSEAEFGASIHAQMQVIKDNFNAFAESVDLQSAEVLKEALEPTFEKSQEIVPYLSGRLHDSGYLETRQLRGSATVEIGYARGGNPDYAVFVHENLEVHHRPPTQAKFLQQPLEEDAEAIQQRIIDGYKTVAGL